MNISFREVQEGDITMLWEWLQNSVVSKRYTDVDLWYDVYHAKVMRKILSEVEFSYLIEIDTQQVGYIQCYNCLGADKKYREPFVSEWTRWVDMFIGEDARRGKWLWWVILRNFVEQIVQGIHYAKKVMIDPDQENIPAVKAYQKAWFIIDREIQIDGEKELLMYYN